TIELCGHRKRLDTLALTRPMKGYDRLPDVYGELSVQMEPGSIAAFRFDRIYFCSQTLRDETERAGFRVSHAEIIPHGIPTERNEPFSRTILEALASGLPVVGSAAGAAGELLRHGENALTFAPGNAEELALRIQELQTNAALRCRLAEAGQSEVLSRFNETSV